MIHQRPGVLKIAATALAGFLLVGSSVTAAQQSDRQPVKVTIPVNSVEKINQWVILGPFSIPGADSKNSVKDCELGIDTDYLASLGGEAKAELVPGFSLQSKEAKTESGSTAAKQVSTTLENGYPVLRFDNLFSVKEGGNLDFSVAYAFTTIQSDRNRKCTICFGSDDMAKIWVNGQQVLSKNFLSAIDPMENLLVVDLIKGRNTVMVKVANGQVGWGFSLSSISQSKYDSIMAERKKVDDYKQFMGMGFSPKDRWMYTFQTGTVPDFRWDNPEIANLILSDAPMKVRWFNTKAEEVEKPTEPGRYGVVIEATTKTGTLVRRSMTLYCCSKDYSPWGPDIKVPVDNIPNCPVDPAVWKEHQDEIQKNMGWAVKNSFFNSDYGVALLAYLAEQKPTGKAPSKLDNATISHDDFQLAIKLKLLGAEGKYKPLQMPHKKQGAPAPELTPGTLQEGGFKSDMPEKVRAVCNEWTKADKEPFVVCIARHGKIVMHESFSPDGQPIPLNQPMEMASITKAMSGMLFAQFLDQGLINLEDPVGKYLPYFPTQGEKVITLRECFTHTNGLWSHYDWGGMHNPWLDNVIADALPIIQPAKKMEYNGMGYDLAGKVMEIVAGKSIFRLFQENFFVPLGAVDTVNDDLACATQSSAENIARMAQLLLNKGSYGDTEFFSPATFEQMLPQKLEKYYPNVKNIDWGIGLAYFRSDFRTDSGQNGVPKNTVLLSPNTIGHGAASSSIFRADLDHDLVVTLARNRSTSECSYYTPRFLQAIDDGMIKDK